MAGIATATVGVALPIEAAILEEDFGRVIRCGKYTATLDFYSRYWSIKGGGLRLRLPELWFADNGKTIKGFLRTLA